jgi:hypothetical protein
MRLCGPQSRSGRGADEKIPSPCQEWNPDLPASSLVENWMLSRMFGSEREEVARGWRRLHNELHKLHASPIIIRLMLGRWMYIRLSH